MAASQERFRALVHPAAQHGRAEPARDAGCLDRVTGIVFGQMRGCHAGETSSFTLQDVVQEALGGFDGPVAWGLVSGHVDGPFVTLPLGVRARLACGGEGLLAVEEAVVS